MKLPTTPFLPSRALAATTAAAMACALLAGCASVNRPRADDAELVRERETQNELIVERQLRRQRRLDGIAFDFMRRNAPLCGNDATAGVDARVANLAAFPKARRAAVARRFGVGEGLSVLWTLPGESALREGDRVTSIRGVPAEPGERGLRQWREALQASDGELRLTVWRDGREQPVSATTRPACDYPVMANPDAAINAFNDGEQIVFYAGMLDLFAEDRDIAVVLGHELAHGTRGHVAKGRAAAVFGALLDTALGDTGLVAGLASAPFSRRMEAEADYTGLYMAANAGYDIAQAERVWREIGVTVASSADKKAADTHPSSPERYVAIRRTVAEIQDRQRAGRPLAP